MGPYHEASDENYWQAYLYLNMKTSENAKVAEAWFKSEGAVAMLRIHEDFSPTKVCVMNSETRAQDGTYTIRAQDSPR